MKVKSKVKVLIPSRLKKYNGIGTLDAKNVKVKIRINNVMIVLKARPAAFRSDTSS